MKVIEDKTIEDQEMVIEDPEMVMIEDLEMVIEDHQEMEMIEDQEMEIEDHLDKKEKRKKILFLLVIYLSASSMMI